MYSSPYGEAQYRNTVNVCLDVDLTEEDMDSPLVACFVLDPHNHTHEEARVILEIKLIRFGPMSGRRLTNGDVRQLKTVAILATTLLFLISSISSFLEICHIITNKKNGFYANSSINLSCKCLTSQYCVEFFTMYAFTTRTLSDVSEPSHYH